MTNEKPGCSVSLSLVCTDEQGQVISDIPAGNWYGLDRKMANIFAMDINEAVMDVVDGGVCFFHYRDEILLAAAALWLALLAAAWLTRH